MTDVDPNIEGATAARRRITVKVRGEVKTFTGDPQLHQIPAADTFFVTMPDPSAPSGRRVAWQQRVENGIAEAVEITREDLD
ncbi:hypothetical protein [Mycobacterium shigaense]|uniref:Uncharacterized protein n=1 Tax=Mycobacterium shigaense TaxID=722731 RepID=A0A1Z4EMR8_9MYCO|nr:hypothetical protein [Mycobacterium shigaense]BAX94248.1 hypothetical protein MSG_04127 [Mycobacterium shigaense]